MARERERHMQQRGKPGSRRRKVMVIASGGGHWMEMRRIMPAFEAADCFFVSTDPAYAGDVLGQPYYTMSDVSRRSLWRVGVLLFQLMRILIKERPTVAITTGSLPALVGLALSKYLLGAKTIWIDSIANVDKLSTSGRYSRYVADVWLTQWEHLSHADGPDYWGAVL